MPVVLSYGMGVDSTALLLRWLEEPRSQDFPLDELIVLTAMTGDEWAGTGALVREHILPRLARHRVRFVQVARRGPSTADGVEVLSDSRAPVELHLSGRWRLSDELRAAGTVPQFARGRRLCSVKFKGLPLDAWIAGELGALPFRHVLGFNSEETDRAHRDSNYSSAQRATEYPLITWAWNRRRCEDFILGLLGVRWPKSCCEFCPFAAGRSEALERYRAQPDAAVRALLLEHSSLVLNPRSTLYNGKSLRGCLERDGRSAVALAAFEQALASMPWAVYRVRRLYHCKGRADRSVTSLWTGPASEAQQALQALAGDAQLEHSGGIPRAYLRRRGAGYPAVEEMLAAGPAGVADKERRGFQRRWSRALGSSGHLLTAPPQLALPFG